MSLSKNLLILLLVLPALAFAQTDTDTIPKAKKRPLNGITHLYPIKRTELGVDISSFVKNFLPFNTTSLIDQSTTFANFILGAKVINQKGWAFRSGLNFSARSAEGEIFPVGTRRVSVAARVGFEKQRYLGKHHILYTGADVAFKYEHGFTSESVSGAEENDRSVGLGFAWVGGYNYRLNQWISLGTEMSLGFSRSTIYRDSFNPGFPNSNFKDKSIEGNILINLPTSIYVNFIF